MGWQLKGRRSDQSYQVQGENPPTAVLLAAAVFIVILWRKTGAGAQLRAEVRPGHGTRFRLGCGLGMGQMQGTVGGTEH